MTFSLEPATIIKRIDTECILCKQKEEIELRRITLLFENDVRVMIDAPMCLKCKDETPEKLKTAIASPYLKACLRVAGIGLGVLG